MIASTSALLEHSRPSPTTLTNVSEVLASLAALEGEEQELSQSLSELLSSRQPVYNAFAALQTLSPQVDSTCQDAALLARKVAVTAETADRIGSKVGRLDEEMRRVKSAVERVGKTMELKSSLSDLHAAMDSRDWEAAARHCARAMSFPPEVLTGPFSDLVVPTSEHPVPPLQALEEARETLRDTFLRQFEHASTSRDASEATRFFKLFPTIGWELEGLTAYATFVSRLIHIEPPPSSASSPLYFVAALTALFESVCSIVDQHQAIVTKHYGKDRMQHVVQRLIEECNSIVGRQLDNWEEQRNMKRMATQLASSPIVTVKDPAIQQTRTSDPIDPRDVDKALIETSSLIVRFSAFRRFLYNNAAEQDEFEDEENRTARPSKFEEQGVETGDNNQAQTLLTSIDESDCNRHFEGIITRYYVPFEFWYFRSAIHQAHRLFSVDSSSSPPTSTVPDLVFYLLKAVLQRALGTGSLKVVTGLLPRIRESLENDYMGILKWKISEVYRTSAVMSTNAQTEKAERERRFSLVVLLNDLDVSSLHLQRLIEDIQQGSYIQDSFLDLEMNQVTSQVKELLRAVTSFKTTIKTCVDQVISQLVRPRLRTMPTELLKDITYVLDEDAFSSADYQDIVRKRFIKSWEALVDGFVHVFTDTNYLLFVEIVVDALVRPLEKVILNMRYSELGAIRFDRDIRAIVSYLSSHTTFGGIREKFLRLQQISTLLNIDKEEDLDEFYTGSGIAWKLSISDARKIVSLRT